jgi:hypothetical protein
MKLRTSRRREVSSPALRRAVDRGELLGFPSSRARWRTGSGIGPVSVAVLQAALEIRQSALALRQRDDLPARPARCGHARADLVGYGPRLSVGG